MAVKYKYPNEAEVIIENANDYTIINTYEEGTTTLWQIVGTFNDLPTQTIRQFVSRQVFANSATIVEEDRGTLKLWKLQLDNGTFESLRVTDASNRVYTSEDSDDIFGYLSSTSYSILRENGTRSVFPSVVSRETENEILVTRTTGLNIEFWIPQNGTLAYKLRIFQDGSEVFSRTETYLPEYVRLINRKCSDGLCPVKCGNRVCCYGSNGTATESFLFDESIYSL